MVDSYNRQVVALSDKLSKTHQPTRAASLLVEYRRKIVDSRSGTERQAHVRSFRKLCTEIAGNHALMGVAVDAMIRKAI